MQNLFHWLIPTTQHTNYINTGDIEVIAVFVLLRMFPLFFLKELFLLVTFKPKKRQFLPEYLKGFNVTVVNRFSASIEGHLKLRLLYKSVWEGKTVCVLWSKYI